MERSIVERVVQTFKDGGVVIFPTDTVWGIGASIEAREALLRLYRIKGRPEEKPTAVLVSNLTMARRYGRFNASALAFAKHHWPGALTIIVLAKLGTVPDLVRGGGESVGLRVPAHAFLLGVLHRLDRGIVAGSANFSGEPPPGRFRKIDRKLLTMVDDVVKPAGQGSEDRQAGGALRPLASTVVDTTKKPPVVLRKGPVDLTVDVDSRKGESWKSSGDSLE